MAALDKFCLDQAKEMLAAAKSPGEQSKMWAVQEMETALGRGADGVNLIEINNYLRTSKLARKAASYVDKQTRKEQEKESGISSSAKPGLISPPLHVIEGFLATLSGASADGRIFVHVTPAKAHGADPTVTLKYQLLNPSPPFKEIVEEARCVVLAGGTMAPVRRGSLSVGHADHEGQISVFEQQLLPFLPQDKLSSFSCGHVIPPENLSAVVLSKGPGGHPLTFNFEKRSDVTLVSLTDVSHITRLTSCAAQMQELGMILYNLANVVPDGLVVFLPSYSFLASVKAALEKSGMWTKLDARKSLFVEPNDGSSVEEVLRAYGAAIDTGVRLLP